MANPPFSGDTTDPADNGIVAQFPANERAFRLSIQNWINSVQGPTGCIMAWPGPVSSIPSGALLCNGQTVNRGTEIGLNAVAAAGGYAAPFGPGDGATTFTLPNLGGVTIAGYDAGNSTGRLTGSTAQGVSASTIGNVGGEQAHTQTTAEMATHTHTVSDTGHTHGPVQGQFFLEFNANAGTSLGGGGTASIFGDTSTTSNNTGISNNTTGGGGAHNNVQPTVIMPWIIWR